MLGQTVEAKSRIPAGAIACLCIAASLCVWAALDRNPHPAIAAVLPGLLALGLWLGQPASAVITFEGDGISKLGSIERIPYESITFISAEGREFCGSVPDEIKRPIEIAQNDRILILPPRMTAPAGDLLRFLHERRVPAAERPIPAALAEFAREQRAKFGHERVEVVHARRHSAEQWTRRRNRAIVLALLGVGVVWVALGIFLEPFAEHVDEFVTWIALGVIAVIGAGVVGLCLRSTNLRNVDRQLADHRNACIVLAPSGLAMSQGDMEGVLRWDQILDATTKIPQFLRLHRASGLSLRIHGGEIIALDVYERSPYELSLLVRSRLDGHAT